jgi:hypothetical protein
MRSEVSLGRQLCNSLYLLTQVPQDTSAARRVLVHLNDFYTTAGPIPLPPSVRAARKAMQELRGLDTLKFDAVLGLLVGLRGSLDGKPRSDYAKRINGGIAEPRHCGSCALCRRKSTKPVPGHGLAGGCVQALYCCN